MLNKQGQGKIDWCDWTWNPIAGCQYSKPCDYCYCNRLAKRWKKDFTKYEFRSQYFNDLNTKKLKSGDKIFIGSSGDMWGDWVPAQHIQFVLDEVKKHPELIFIFLTKNPKRYFEFNIPKNCWVGMTIDNNDRYIKYKNELLEYSKLQNIMFISFEPLLENIKEWWYWMDWIIIGANSNIGEKKPPNEWADNLIKKARENNITVWVKDNYKFHTRIKEFPA